MQAQVKESRLAVTFPGDILSTSATVWRGRLEELLRSRCDAPWSVLELDLRAAKMIDSAGLALLQVAVREAKARNTPVTVRISSKTVHRILMFARLDVEILVEGAA